MTNMIEKLQRALEDALKARTEDWGHDFEQVTTWNGPDHPDDPVPGLFRIHATIRTDELAEVVLKAMLEPTEEMNIAGQVVGDYPWDGKKPSRVFTAMIQSALSHNPGTEDGR